MKTQVAQVKRPRGRQTRHTLSPREERFCQEYLIDLSQTDAARRAGYAEKNTKSIAATASRIMTRPAVVARITELKAKRAEKFEITQEQVLRELFKIGFSNMEDYMGRTREGDPFVDLSDLSRDQAAALQEFTVEDYTEGRGENARDIKKVRIKLYDKRAALVDLGKHVGLFPDRHEFSGLNGTPLQPPVFQVSLSAGAPGLPATGLTLEHQPNTPEQPEDPDAPADAPVASDAD